MNKDDFKPFTSYGKKIVPAVTNDWEIHTTFSNRKECLMLKSISLGQQVDMHTNSLFLFFDQNNIQINGRKINASLAVDGRGNFRSDEEFYRWEDYMESLSNNSVKKSDLIIGESYQFDNNDSVIYLGSKFISRSKYNLAFNLENITKISKKHFFYSNKFKTIIQQNKETISYGDDKVLSEEECSKQLNKYYKSKLDICYFEDFNSKDITYKYIDVNKEDIDSNILLFRMKDNPNIFSGYSLNKNSFKKGTTRWSPDRLSVYDRNEQHYYFEFDTFTYEDDITPMRIGI